MVHKKKSSIYRYYFRVDGENKEEVEKLRTLVDNSMLFWDAKGAMAIDTAPKEIDG